MKLKDNRVWKGKEGKRRNKEERNLRGKHSVEKRESKIEKENNRGEEIIHKHTGKWK